MTRRTQAGTDDVPAQQQYRCLRCGAAFQPHPCATKQFYCTRFCQDATVKAAHLSPYRTPVDEKQVARCASDLADGVPVGELRIRFGTRVLRLAQQRVATSKQAPQLLHSGP